MDKHREDGAGISASTLPGVRIFFAVPATAHQGALPDSKLWHVNLFQPLVDLGHDVVVFEFDYSDFNRNLDPSDPQQRAFIEQNRPRLSEELLTQARRASAKTPVDVFFSYFYSSYVLPEAIRELGSAGLVMINWYCNASYQFHLVEEIAPAYDYCLVPERFRLDNYRAVGATPIYCQEAANPAVYRPYDIAQEFDVTFVGQRYGDRAAYLLRLIDEGIDARAWGPRWNEPESAPSPWRRARSAGRRLARGSPKPPSQAIPTAATGPPLSDIEYIQMYSRSAVSLGFTKVAIFNRDGSALRQVPFEASRRR